MIVNLIIIALLVYAAYAGIARGAILAATDLGALVIALLVARLLYVPAAQGLIGSFKMVPSFGRALAYLAILGCIMIAYMFARLKLGPKIPKVIIESVANQVGGAIINCLRGLLVITLALVVYAALPLDAAQKQPVTDPAIPKLLLANSGMLAQSFAQQFGGAITDTVSLFTVDPESKVTIKLGYTLSTGKLDPIDEAKLLTLTNQERTSRQLSTLTANPKAAAVARAHSRDMFERGYFSHVTPEREDPFQRLSVAGVKYSAAGENLVLAPTLQLAETSLMNSPPHRANILSPDYQTVGIGIIDGGPYGLMVTEDFTN